MIKKKSVALLASTLLAFGFGTTNAYGAQSNVIIQSCIADEVYTPTSKTTGWLPTNLTSPEVTSQSTAIQGTYTASTDLLYTGTTSITKSTLVSDSNATYGMGYATRSSLSKSWNYSGSIPVGSTGKVLVLHRADKITFTKYKNNADCTTNTYTGLVAYLPYSSTLSSSYCSIVDIYPYKTNWSVSCVD